MHLILAVFILNTGILTLLIPLIVYFYDLKITLKK